MTSLSIQQQFAEEGFLLRITTCVLVNAQKINWSGKNFMRPLALTDYVLLFPTSYFKIYISPCSLKQTPEFKAWEQEHGVGASPSWQARLEQAKALIPPSLVPYTKHIAIVSIIMMLLVVPMLFPLAASTTAKSSATTTTSPATATAAAAKGKTPSSPISAPGAITIPTPQKKTLDTLKDAPNPGTVAKENGQQKETAAAQLQLEISKAKRTAAAAQQEQRVLAVKLEEASKREAVLIEENKRLTAAIHTASAKKATSDTRSSLRKAFSISGGGRGQALKPPAQTTGKPIQYILQYTVYYLASLGPDVGLLTIEAGLLILAAVLMLGLQKSRQAAEHMKKEYLVAYRRQMAMLGKAEEAYEAACTAQSAAEKVATEAREGGDSSSGESVAAAGAAAAAAAAAAAVAEATAKKKEEELQVKERQLEKKVEEVKASAAAQTSAWAAAAAQLLELAASSPNKNNKNQPQQKSRLSKSSTPPSPGTVVTITDKYTQLRTRLTSAEAAAIDAASVAETARREREHSEQRVSEMITDNELLKERLADTKKALAVATDAKAAAELHEAEVRAALEIAQQNLATVEAEKEHVLKEANALKESLKKASEEAAATVKGGDLLKAQVDQLTVSLGDESAQKQRAEQRCAQLQTDLSSLQILADGLQNQVSALEQRLEESVAAQTELEFASKQLEAAHAAALKAASASNTNPALVQRALNEESAALERLTTAERRATEASTLTSYALTGGEDVAPRPALPLTSRSGGSSIVGTYPPSSPHIVKASSLIARTGKIASMLEGMDGFLGGASFSPPDSGVGGFPALTSGSAGAAGALSARSGGGMHSSREEQQHLALRNSRRRSSNDSFESGSLTARMARASQLFTTAQHYLGQELPSLDSASEAAGKRPYRDIPLLLASDATVNVKVNGAKESLSSAGEGITRLIAAGNTMVTEAENLQASLGALGNNPASSAAAERLAASQVKVAAAVSNAEAATRSAEEKRGEHAQLASVARENQRQLEDAQLALTAAMEDEEDEESNRDSSAAVATAAQHLETAETAQQAASEAVYQAERDMYAAVSAQLAARDALRCEQDILQEAFALAAQLLSGSESVTGGKDAAKLEAFSISPRVPIGIKNASPADVFAYVE
jgi:hypothetical protein